MARRNELWVWLLLGALACTGGQSGNEGALDEANDGKRPEGGVPEAGSPDGAPASDGHGNQPGECDPNGPGDCQGIEPPIKQPCPCGNFSGWIALRAVVSAFESGRAQVQVHAWLDGRTGCPRDDAPPDLPTVGETVGGAFDGTLPCASACSGIALGDEVLALYQRGDQDGLGCSDYRACSKERCGSLPVEGDGNDGEDYLDVLAAWDVCDMQCLEETRSACAARDDEARLHGRLELAPWAPEIDLGGYLISDEDGFALVADVEACEAAVTPKPVESAPQGSMAGEPSDSAGAAEQDAVDAPLPPPSDAGVITCAVNEGTLELEPVEPPRCDDAGLSLLEPSLHGNEAECPGPDAGELPIECSDVCGTLSLCSEGEVACGPCLSRCAASGPASVGGGTCLSRAIYLIDEEGCDRMLDVYQDFDAETDCDQQ